MNFGLYCDFTELSLCLSGLRDTSYVVYTPNSIHADFNVSLILMRKRNIRRSFDDSRTNDVKLASAASSTGALQVSEFT